MCFIGLQWNVIESYPCLNHGLDKKEVFEDFGDWGSSHFLADHALVIMVWGLLSKWKQPVGYFFTAGPFKPDKLQQLTRNCLHKLEKIGLHTKVVICDQGSNNRKFLKKLEGVSVQKPYIVHNNNKVFVMHNPPYLLKNIHNNFMKSNYRYDDVDIRWEYVVDLQQGQSYVNKDGSKVNRHTYYSSPFWCHESKTLQLRFLAIPLQLASIHYAF